VRLCFYTYSYTDRLKMPTVDCLEKIAKTGYSGIDVSGTDGPSDDPKSFRPDLRKLTRTTAERLKLKIEAVITHAQLTDSLFDETKKPLDLKGSVDLAVDLGAPVVTFHMGGYPKGVEKDVAWKKTAAWIREAAEYGAARHVQLAVDGIWPEWLNDSIDAQEKMFKEVDSPAFGLNFDPCYLTLMDVSPVEFVRRFSAKLFHAHLKDHRGKYFHKDKWKHLIPGKGDMDYVVVFKALLDAKWDRAAAVECFTDMKFEEACDDGFAAMTAAAGKAGVKFGR
jgi:sugar phosphate isomerase/epimerase